MRDWFKLLIIMMLVYVVIPCNVEASNDKNLYDMLKEQAVMDNIKSTYVNSNSGIDFMQSPSDTNGKGVYELSSTKDDKYPVYYYRGAVTNNNVLFANFCWKIVRTTSTGGVKLIYNGVPDSNGMCNNTGTDSQIGTSKFNLNDTSPADVGYMYGTRYTYSTKSMSSSSGFVYGNDVTYENGVYTLKDTMTSAGWSSDYKTIATKYHYTCLSTETTCSSVYYIDYFDSSTLSYYLTLSDGKNIDDVKAEMFTNTNDSTVKTTIDTWYKENMISYTRYLEDTVWCNDRSISSGPLKGKDEDSSSNTYTYFSPRTRNDSSYTPSLVCSNVNDSFTVNSSNGNGALTYPVALLTADEATLAGNGSRGYSYLSYLYTGQNWWTMSPGIFFGSSAENGRVNYRLSDYYVYQSFSIRPSISLKLGTMITGGEGTIANPYILRKEYAITTVEEYENLQIDKDYSAAGELVKLNISDSNNYNVKEVIVTDSLGNKIEVDNYMFEMPESDVIIKLVLDRKIDNSNSEEESINSIENPQTNDDIANYFIICFISVIVICGLLRKNKLFYG